ncbi:hypothetical protein MMC22_008426 [Lobaria immixta]|nr:hypothetical protein [Lobaria immixta]
MPFNLQATIQNELAEALIPDDTQPDPTSGTVTKAPVKIKAGTREEVSVHGADPNQGAAGKFIYYVMINKQRVDVTLNFQVNNAGKNYATLKTTAPGIINFVNTPYSPDEHPLIGISIPP